MLIPSPQDVPTHLVFSTALSLRNKGEELMICWRNLKGRVIINHLNHHKPIYFPSYHDLERLFSPIGWFHLLAILWTISRWFCFKISLPCHQSLLSREVKRPFAWKSAIKDSLSFPRFFVFGTGDLWRSLSRLHAWDLNPVNNSCSSHISVCQILISLSVVS